MFGTGFAVDGVSNIRFSRRRCRSAADAQEIQLGFGRRLSEICLDGRGGFADQLEREFPNVGGAVRRHRSTPR